jgi:hypothetical protein
LRCAPWAKNPRAKPSGTSSAKSDPGRDRPAPPSTRSSRGSWVTVACQICREVCARYERRRAAARQRCSCRAAVCGRRRRQHWHAACRAGGTSLWRREIPASRAEPRAATALRRGRARAPFRRTARRLVSIDPSADSKLELARLERKTGHRARARAREHVRSVLKDTPDTPEAHAILTQLPGTECVALQKLTGAGARTFKAVSLVQPGSCALPAHAASGAPA